MKTTRRSDAKNETGQHKESGSVFKPRDPSPYNSFTIKNKEAFKIGCWYQQERCECKALGLVPHQRLKVESCADHGKTAAYGVQFIS